MPKTSIYLPADLASEVQRHNISISEVSQRALRQAVQRAREQEMLTEGMNEIRVETGPPPSVTEVFVGTWLVEPYSERASTNETGYDRNGTWGIALTKRGRIAVYAADQNRQRAARLYVHESLESAAEQLPSDIARLAAEKLGLRIIYRDI